MSDSAGHSPRLLAFLIPLGIAAHMVLAGSRVTVSLAALAAGASAFTVGVLIALYALLPMLAAVAAGRVCDRVGVRKPMLLSTAALAIGVLLPLVARGLPGFVACATIVGTAFMMFQIATQRATGDIGGPADRARNFSLLALGYSVSGFVGPLVAGFTIDHFGFGAAFGIFAVVALCALGVLAAARIALPGPHPAAAGGRHDGGVRALLAHRTVRQVLVLNTLVSVGWDLHTVFMPIYGARVGLSASEIGMVLASFAAATFVVRFGVPAIARRLGEYRVLTTALLFAGAVYFLFPLSHSALTLGALSFCLGLGLGSGQPVVMSLLHQHAPPGRVGEAVGLRMSLVQSSSVAVPLLSGALGASLGLTPVFVTVGACLAAGGWLSRRRGRL